MENRRSTPVTSRALGRWRWELLSAVFILCTVALVRYAGVPLGRHVWNDMATIRQDLVFARKSSTLPEMESTVEMEMTDLRTSIAAEQDSVAFSEAALLEHVYRHADTAMVTASKVEIGSPVSTEEGREIPVSVMGSGRYRPVGVFVDSIENMSHATRVRALTLKGSRAGTELFLDFVVLVR